MKINEKDKIIVEEVSDVALETALAVADEIAGLIPGLGVAWKLSKAINEAGLKLRNKRAIEWVEMIRDNSGIYTKEILETEEFQDGFVYAIEKYLAERVEEKRKIIKNIFCGFTIDKNKKDFKLERFLWTAEQITLEQVEVLKIFCDGTIRKWLENQFKNMEEEEITKHEREPLNITQIGKYILDEMKCMTQFRNSDYTHEVLERLSTLGLVITGIQANWDVSSSTFKISNFGKEFVKFSKM